MSNQVPLSALEDHDAFVARHIGPNDAEIAAMLKLVGHDSLDAMTEAIVPGRIRNGIALDLPGAMSEVDALAKIRAIARKNKVFRSFIGQGYYGTHMPNAILRNILENPAWYTAYTPYQAEISQGRMEALINFQTICTDLTGMEIASASLLDEATAAAEAMTLAKRSAKNKSNTILVSGDTHPQTIEVLRTRAEPLDIDIALANGPDEWKAALDRGDFFGVLISYPASSGWLADWSKDCDSIHANHALFVVATDLLALTLLKPPGEMGADIVIGNTQRFGVPFGFGGPHAAFMACRDAYKRNMPGRLIGVSVDAEGNKAYRLTLQTREQHIRREKATSNICTAQVLLAVMASMYAVYHGPEGLSRIANRVHRLTSILRAGLAQLGYTQDHHPTAFDTLSLKTDDRTDALIARAAAMGVNLRKAWNAYICISLDETSTRDDVRTLWRIFGGDDATLPDLDKLDAEAPSLIPAELRRSSAFLTHPVFNTHHSEHEMLRYMRSLADKDLAMDRTMIPLGSCTMKLNATAEMIPVTWPEFANIHPFAPAEQTAGYQDLIAGLEAMLVECTGYDAVSLQPNSGAQGEYAGLLAIRAYHAARGEPQRDVCLIPESAHGTNPASAQLCGMKVVVVACDKNGNVDVDDLRAKAGKHSNDLSAIMITYPVHARRVRGIGGGDLRDRPCQRQRRRGGHPSRRREALGEPGRDHDDLPLHPRRVRGGRRRDLRDRPSPWRTGVHRRRQHECAGRRGQARQVGQRRVAPQPAQDLLHPARWRRPGRRPDWRQVAPRPVPAQGRRSRWLQHRRRGRRWHGQRGHLRQRQHPADQLDVHHPDGCERPA